MALSRKNYEAVAAIIDDELACQTYPNNPIIDAWYANERAALRSVAERLASYFQSDNERFDRARFLKACGL